MYRVHLNTSPSPQTTTTTTRTMHNTLQLRVKSANYMQILIGNVRIADKWHLGNLLLKFIAIVAPPRSRVMCTKLKYREEKKNTKTLLFRES